MSNAYTITIKNASLVKQSFMLFQSLPKPSNLPQSNVFTNVYQRSNQIQGDGINKATFQITNEYWAVYGTSSQSTDGLVKISTSDSRKVTLGPAGSFFVLSTLPGDDDKPDGVSPFFDAAQAGTQTTDAGGAFTIRSDGSFSVLNPNNIYIGVGAKDPKSGDIVPIQSYRAQPNVVAQLFPRIKFYVAFGHYEPGAIVSMAELGNVLEVDFTGSPGHDATFTLNDHNSYDPDPSVGASGIKWRMTSAV